MRGAIPPLLQYVFMAWYLVRHRDNFTFTFYILGVDSQNCQTNLISRRMSPCSTHGRDEKFIQDFCRKPEGKRQLGRPRRKWEDNFIMDPREIGWEGEDWIHLAQDRDQWRAAVNTVMNLRDLYETGNFLTS
jgi:hypothetical protein